MNEITIQWMKFLKGSYFLPKTTKSNEHFFVYKLFIEKKLAFQIYYQTEKLEQVLQKKNRTLKIV